MERIVIKPGQEVIIDGKIFYWEHSKNPGEEKQINITFKELESGVPISEMTVQHQNDWLPFKFSEIAAGNIVRNKGSKRNYMVTGNYGDRATGVAVVDITNPDEWEVLKQQ